MNIAVLLDYLQEELEAGSNMPFSQKTAVDSGKCLDLINDMRTTLPREITEAEGILNEKNNILYEAEREAEKIIAEVAVDPFLFKKCPPIILDPSLIILPSPFQQ